MTAEQVLRALLVKQMAGFSYDQLVFHLADSATYQRFCRLDPGRRTPSKTALKRSFKAITAETLEQINRVLVLEARARKMETGHKVRTDCTVVLAPIHDPTDSSLLWDCVRVLTRLMERANELAPVAYTDHTRRAKRRALGIQHASSKEKRLPLYRDLLKVVTKTMKAAKRASERVSATGLPGIVVRMQIDHYLSLTRRVVDQTERRVLHGESVTAREKLVSIFEPHTDVIVKDRRETLYGHKVCLTAGASGLVLDLVVQNGNPADATLAVDMISRQTELYGCPPRQACFDGAFASKANLSAIKAAGVTDVAFSKSRFLGVTEMVKSSWVYRRLRNFRAGVESVISFLKRCLGLDRCTWRSLNSFKAYTWASTIAANLLQMARHALQLTPPP
jgi:IS5 family transposase